MACFIILASLSACLRVLRAYLIPKVGIALCFLFFQCNISTFLPLVVDLNHFYLHICSTLSFGGRDSLFVALGFISHAFHFLFWLTHLNFQNFKN